MERPHRPGRKRSSASGPRLRPAGRTPAAAIATSADLSAFAVVFEHHQAVALLIRPDDGAIADANPAASVFYGYSTDELRSMNLGDLEQAPIEIVREECALAAQQVRQRFEVPHRTSDGEIRFVEVISSPIRLASMSYLCAIITDISRRQVAEQERERKAKDLATLLDVSQAMAMTLDLPSVLQTIIEKATDLVGLDTGAIYLVRGAMLHLEATTPPLPPNMPEEFREAWLEEHPHIKEAFRLAQPLTVSETTSEPLTPQEQAIIDMRGLRSLLYIPLVIERRTIGVLILGSVGRPRTYTGSEIDLCRTFSVQAAVTVENALMYDTTTRYARELEARIAERDRAQQERLNLESQLFQAQRRESIGTLASGIAHDFNNILSIIIGNASLLASGRHDAAKDAKRIEAILTATTRATQVVRQLLTIARKTEMVRRPTDVNRLVQELCHLLEETFPRNIHVGQDLEPALSPIYADPNQLHQVLLNLAVNARDAMPRGGEVLIRTRTVSGRDLQGRSPQAELKPYVEISVIDTGEGMDEATQSKIFDPFFTTKGVGKGSGLGLAVSLGIVESHAGFLEVTSSPTSGSVFRTYLPAVFAPSDVHGHASSVDGIGARGAEVILIVEDEPLLRESVSELFARHGYTVLTASNGLEAIEIFRRQAQQIGLVLSDYGLPAYDGEELHRRMSAMGIRVPFVLMTGFIELEKKGDVIRAGVRDIIMKPFNPDELLARVRMILDEGHTSGGPRRA